MKLKTKTEQQKHNDLIRLSRLGLHEQVEIMSKELYAKWYIDQTVYTAPPVLYRVVHVTTWSGDQKSYILCKNND